MKVNLRSITTRAILVLCLLFFRETSSRTFSYLRSTSSSNGATSFDDDDFFCSDAISFVGQWKLIEAFENNDEISVPWADDIVFEFREGDDLYVDYTLNIAAANTFGTWLNIAGRDGSCYDDIDVGSAMSTKMYPPERFIQIENFLSLNIESMNMIKITERMGNKGLVMKGDNAELYCEYISS
mmetsp:Transcript_14321/g.18073  ORF Transcript_14321/g.18073 Transcript_14321/m.18073 type:complete len:183 (-) Transcript_14321:112-660(-)